MHNSYLAGGVLAAEHFRIPNSLSPCSNVGHPPSLGPPTGGGPQWCRAQEGPDDCQEPGLQTAAHRHGVPEAQSVCGLFHLIFSTPEGFAMMANEGLKPI